MTLLKNILSWCLPQISASIFATMHLCLAIAPAVAQTTALNASDNEYCFLPAAAVSEKNKWRSAAMQGDPTSQERYTQITNQHAQQLQNCRQRSWLKTQALWLRMYPCDSRPGAVDELLDYAVNRGYNQVYLATFYAGQVLLPQATNPTIWPSVLATGGVRQTDLLAEVIKKGRARGLKVYAWVYSLSFGSNYALQDSRETTISINGRGEKSWFAGNEGSQPIGDGPASVLFVNPHSRQARTDFSLLVNEVVKRKPDGILFDYIRYPKGQGGQSIASNVKDLWIYGEESRKNLEEMSQNKKGAELIKLFLDQGSIRAANIAPLDALFPEEREPMWDGRQAVADELKLPPKNRAALYQKELWSLAVNYAGDGVVQYLSEAANVAQRSGVKSGTIFFPEGNRSIGQGFDSRLQQWPRFSPSMEWHPMAYAICGKSKCIGEQVAQVVRTAPSGTIVVPALAGVWGKSFENRPAMELQLAEIRQTSPQINAISHFSYSWQEPASDGYRSTCRLNK
jgi:Glycosyl hydrolase-like 10